MAIVAAVAVVGSAVGLATHNKLITAIFGGPLAFAVSSNKKPKIGTPAFTSSAQGRIINTQSSNDPRKVIYGKIRVGGTQFYLGTANDKNGGKNTFLYTAITLCNHESDSIETYYVNEDVVTLNSNGYVIAPSKYLASSNSKNDPLAGKSRIRITYHNGASGQVADANWVKELSQWTSEHVGNNLSYLAIRLEYDNNVFPNGLPQFSAVVKGKKVYDPRTGLTQWSDNTALCLLDYITTGQGNPNQTFGINAGPDEWDQDSFIAAANICDEQILLANMTGTISYANGSNAVTGVGTTFTKESNLPIGTVLYDTTNNVTIGTIQSITNDTHIVLTSAFSGTSESNVTYSTHQSRYSCNGMIDVSQSKANILHDLVSAFAGDCFFAQGKFWCFAGAYTDVVADIDESWLADQMIVTRGPGLANLFNQVTGTFVDPTQNWQPVSFPAVKNASYVAADGSDRAKPTNLPLPFTTESQMAQRIAKIYLEKARQDIVVELSCNWKALGIMPTDTVALSIAEMGWDHKIFKVTEWDLNQNGGYSLVLREENTSVYDWNNGEATIYSTAGNSNLLDPNTIEPPGTPSISESIYETVDGKGLGVKVYMSWAASPEALATSYVVEYQGPDDSDFTFFAQTQNTFTNIFDLAPGTYTFRVKAVSWRNVSSDWVSITYTVVGLTTPPQEITNFALTSVHNQAHLTWDQSPDLSVKVGGSIEIRYTPITSGAVWNNGTALGPDLAGVSTNTTLPLKTGTYMIKAKSFNGLESNIANMVVSTEANLFNLASVISLTENPSFSGTKTNLYVDPSTNLMSFSPTGLFDSEPGLFDAHTGIFDNGNGVFNTSGSYIFSNFIDMGSTYTVRVNGFLNFLIYDPINLFDSAAGNFDDRAGLFDGTDAGKITADWYIKTTTSNPTGKTYTDPIWGDWTLFPGGVGDITARAYWLKLVFTSEDSSISFQATSLNTNVQVGTRTESFLGQAISSGGTTLTYSKPFFGKPAFRYDINSSISGDTISFTHVVSGGKYTGVTVQVLNSGSGVARTINLFADGY